MLFIMLFNMLFLAENYLAIITSLLGVIAGFEPAILVHIHPKYHPVKSNCTQS